MTKEYKALKNLIHNELGISKKDINNIVEKTIEEEARSYIKRYFQKNEKASIKIAESTIEVFLKKELKSTYSTFTRSLRDKISEVVAKKVEIKVKDE